ncbi:MAG: adenine nucleotide alpha hydrolase [Treponema sp.]|nr:adenine nucleotide alpha hydrolase [Treponema sp.]
MSWRPGSALLSTLEGKPPPWADRFVRRVGASVHRFGMIRDGDGVLVGVSGGKDSLALCLALELRRRRVRDAYRLQALLVDWDDAPMPVGTLEDLRAYFDCLGVPFRVRPASRSPRGSLGGCYECARMRKMELFRAAREAGLGVVALGHHLDDMAETLIMNLVLHGRFEGMEPVRSFFRGEARVVRPLCALREGSVRTFAERMELPVAAFECGIAAKNPRRKAKALLVELGKIDRLVREHLFLAYAGRRSGAFPGAAGGQEARESGARESGREGVHGNP